MKTNKEELEQRTRLPRPLGVTTLMRQKRLKEAKDQILTQWVTNNFTLCQITYSIPDIAKMLNMTPALVVRNITKPIKTLLLTGNGEESYQALIGLLFSFTLSDRAQSQNQLNILLADQQGHYKPFLSSTIGHAITNLLQSTKGFLDLTKLLKPEVAKSIDTPLTNPLGSTQGSKFLGTVEAMKLIEANRGANLLEPGSLQDSIIGKEIEKDLPEVVATKQQGLDSSGLEKKPKKRIHDTSVNPDIKDAIIIP